MENTLTTRDMKTAQISLGWKIALEVAKVAFSAI